ncbi:hypothetical protein FPV67DRAFT_1460842 [Lyophyllum atratum]|nr:hypothetical protein FPV67DRAFT_1460842 [Lyophyllum atratum]
MSLPSSMVPVADVPFAESEWRIKIVRKEPLRFFWEPNAYGLWCSPNATRFSKPLSSPRDDFQRASLWVFFRRPRRIRWLETKYPFLAFWPMQWLWTGIFQSLNVVPGLLQVVSYRNGPGYHMHPVQIKEWQTLEDSLIRLGRFLLERHYQPQYDFQVLQPAVIRENVDTTTYIRPPTMSSELQWRRARLSSPSPLMLPSLSPSTWRNSHMKKGRRPPGLYSPKPRVLMRHLWMKCPVQFYPAFSVANAPLFICWGEETPKSMVEHDPIWRYYPCAAEVEAAQEEFERFRSVMTTPRQQRTIPTFTSPQRTIPTFTSPLSDRRPRLARLPYASVHSPAVAEEDSPQSPPPQMERMTGKMYRRMRRHSARRKRDPKKFLARLAKEREEAMAQETDEEKTWRTQGEFDAGVQSDHIRVASGRKEHIFEGASCPRRMGESLDRLCPRRAPLLVSYDEWNLIKYGGFFVTKERDVPKDPAAAPLTKIMAFFRSTTRMDGILPLDDEDDAFFRSTTRMMAFFRSTTTMRTGARAMRTTGTFRKAPAVQEFRTALEFPNLEKILYESTGSWAYTRRNALLDRLNVSSLSMTSSAATSKLPLSSPLWDLAPSNLKGIVEHGYLHYRRIDATHHVIGIRSEPLVEQWLRYFAGGSMEWPILRATSSLMAFDSQPANLYGNPRLATSMPSQHSLGHRNAGYVFTQSDYTKLPGYTTQLLTGPVLRAAMMKGESHGGSRSISAGTTSSLKAQPRPASTLGRRVGELDGRVLVDDDLDEGAASILCGVYKVYTISPVLARVIIYLMVLSGNSFVLVHDEWWEDSIQLVMDEVSSTTNKARTYCSEILSDGRLGNSTDSSSATNYVRAYYSATSMTNVALRRSWKTGKFDFTRGRSALQAGNVNVKSCNGMEGQPQTLRQGREATVLAGCEALAANFVKYSSGKPQLFHILFLARPDLFAPAHPAQPRSVKNIVADHWAAESDDKWQRSRPEVKLGSLSKAKMKLLREIFSDIVEEWPTSNSLEHADSLALSLVNQHVFLMECVQIRLGRRANRAGNANSSTTAYGLGQGHRAASAKNDFVPSHFKKCWDASNDYREIFSGARRSGRKCRQDAVWIGLERLSIDTKPSSCAIAEDLSYSYAASLTMKSRRSTIGTLSRRESSRERTRVRGLRRGRVHSNQRLNAPDLRPSCRRPTNALIILWTKDGPDDENPTWNKVFGGVVYKIHKLDTTFGDENQLVMDEMTGVELAVQYVFIDLTHSKSSGSTWSEDSNGRDDGEGPGSSSGIWTAVSGYDILSDQTYGGHLQEPSRQRLRRTAANAGHSGQSIDWVQGTRQRRDLCILRPAAMLNRDDSCTCGWVMRRSARDGGASLLVLDAPNDSHGTTTNNLALSHPANYGAYIKSAPDRAQWTRVTVLPSAVLAADIRKDNE